MIKVITSVKRSKIKVLNRGYLLCFIRFSGRPNLPELFRSTNSKKFLHYYGMCTSQSTIPPL